MNSWRKAKKTGNYYKSLKKDREQFEKRVNYLREQLITKNIKQTMSSRIIVNMQQINTNGYNFSENPLPPSNLLETDNFSADIDNDDKYNSFDSEDENIDDEISKNQKLLSSLRQWALNFNINHLALKALLKIFNEYLPKTLSVLPEDPRTLLQTPKTIELLPLSDGEYWHNGLGNNLKTLFQSLDKPITISLNFNIGGLPLYKSSKIEFWPILFNIAEMPQISAMVIGIFCGKAKTSDVETFLTPFVEELNNISTNGIFINSHKVKVKIRCFVCDSPARAFVKGVANFNSQHGCIKCTTVGEYSYVTNTNIFPRTHCEKRRDSEFRQKLYGSHHKMDSPLLKLNIDMVEQFPVGDSLHLLHLGVMKRLLFGWRDGTFRNPETKWPAKTTNDISEFLLQCKLPVEFHRVIRGLDCLSHWKATEYRTFLHYVGFVLLKDYLPLQAYENFLLLFCSVTICSSKQYFQFLPLARMLLNQYIEIFSEIYGDQYLTSNVHNLTHLVDEVERFGVLESFSAYLFENMLGKIKQLTRNGNRPLSQVAKRIIEGVKCTSTASTDEISQSQGNTASSNFKKIMVSKKNNGENIPSNIKHIFYGVQFYSKVEFDEFCLSTDLANCWFLTNQNDIARLTNIAFRSKNDMKLCYVSIKEKRNFFNIPIESSYLNIYCTNSDVYCNESQIKILDFTNIKCKLVRIRNVEANVFVPLLHTKQ